MSYDPFQLVWQVVWSFLTGQSAAAPPFPPRTQS